MSKETDIEEAAEKYRYNYAKAANQSQEDAKYIQDVAYYCFKAGASWQQSQSIPAPVEDNFTDEEKQSFEDMYSKALDFMNKDEPVDSEPVYKWVKASDELPEIKTVFIRFNGNPHIAIFHKKYFYVSEANNFGLDDYSKIEWLKEINQPVEDAHEAFLSGQTVMYKAMKAEDKLQKAIDWCDEKMGLSRYYPSERVLFEEMKQYLQQL